MTLKIRSDKKVASTKQCGDNAKSDLNLGDNFKSVTEINGFLTKYFVTDESKSCHGANKKSYSTAESQNSQESKSLRIRER